jgi:predicted aldo/keto reductase-like oxidoreductase
MKRREFIFNSLLAAAGTAALGACGASPAANAKEGGGGKVATRKFKNLDIPLLSFGCMRLPTSGGKIDLAHFESMVDYAMQHGVNYFDTAWFYHSGQSENAVGKVLKNYKRSSFFLATKNPIRSLTSKADVRMFFEEQLRKCQTDYFDFYMAHNVSVLTEDNFYNFEVYDEMMKIKEEGKIRHLGFSYHGRHELLKRIANQYHWEFCQLQLNYLDWKTYAADDGESSFQTRDVYKNYEVVEEAKIPVIAMSPLRGGALSRLTGSAAAIIADEAPQDTPTSFALRWAASKENTLTVLSGMSSLEQLKENVETFINYRPFNEKENEIADRLCAILQKQGEINCTTCNYCADCPRGVKISEIFDAYNQYKATGDGEAFLKRYDALPERCKAERCVRCNLCNEHCPQQLDIPPLLDKVKETLASLRNGVK